MLCIPAGIAAILLVYFGVDKAPEKDLALLAAKANPAIQALFGESAQLSYNREGSSGIEFHPGGRREGRHRFDVVGPRDRGTILVRWTSRGKGEDFKVRAIERCTRGETNQIIWKQD